METKLPILTTIGPGPVPVASPLGLGAPLGLAAKEQGGGLGFGELLAQVTLPEESETGTDSDRSLDPAEGLEIMPALPFLIPVHPQEGRSPLSPLVEEGSSLAPASVTPISVSGETMVQLTPVEAPSKGAPLAAKNEDHEGIGSQGAGRPIGGDTRWPLTGITSVVGKGTPGGGESVALKAPGPGAAFQGGLMSEGQASAKTVLEEADKGEVAVVLQQDTSGGGRVPLAEHRSLARSSNDGQTAFSVIEDRVVPSVGSHQALESSHPLHSAEQWVPASFPRELSEEVAELPRLLDRWPGDDPSGRPPDVEVLSQPVESGQGLDRRSDAPHVGAKGTPLLREAAPTAMLPSARETVRLHLEPADLGRVTMQVSVQAHQVHATMSVQHQGLGEYLVASQGALEEAMRQQGLHMEEFHVDAGAGGTSHRQDAPEFQGRHEAESPRKSERADGPSGVFGHVEETGAEMGAQRLNLFA